MPDPDYLLRLRPLPVWKPRGAALPVPVAQRLRSALKLMLRCCGLQVVSVEEVPAKER
jgi:hypothetical protein